MQPKTLNNYKDVSLSPTFDYQIISFSHCLRSASQVPPVMFSGNLQRVPSRQPLIGNQRLDPRVYTSGKFIIQTHNELNRSLIFSQIPVHISTTDVQTTEALLMFKQRNYKLQSLTERFAKVKPNQPTCILFYFFPVFSQIGYKLCNRLGWGDLQVANLVRKYPNRQGKKVIFENRVVIDSKQIR